jgi:hypothetical protein
MISLDAAIALLVLGLMLLGVLKLYDVYRAVRRWRLHHEEQYFLRTIRLMRQFEHENPSKRK